MSVMSLRLVLIQYCRQAYFRSRSATIQEILSDPFHTRHTPLQAVFTILNRYPDLTDPAPDPSRLPAIVTRSIFKTPHDKYKFLIKASKFFWRQLTKIYVIFLIIIWYRNILNNWKNPDPLNIRADSDIERPKVT
jgi:hypothetical protein